MRPNDDHVRRVKDAAEDVVRSDAGVLRKLAPYDHTFQVKAWRDGPYWYLEIEAPQWALSETERGYWGTQTPWLRLADYMAKDYLVCMLDLDYRHWDQITVNVTKGIGPMPDHGGYPKSSWLWAQLDGVKDMVSKWRVERDVRKSRSV